MPEIRPPLTSHDEGRARLLRLLTPGTRIYCVQRNRTRHHVTLDPFYIDQTGSDAPDMHTIRGDVAAVLYFQLDLDRGGVYTDYTSTTPERELAEALADALYGDRNALRYRSLY